MSPEKKSILGVGISKTSYDDVVTHCRKWLAREHPDDIGAYICVTSVHGIISAVLDPALRAILNQAWIATPDGMPVVWAMRSFGVRNQARVYGPTLMLKLCEMAAQRKYSIFLYGATPKVLTELRRNLMESCPGLCVAGVYSPPFRRLTPHERVHVIDRIRDSGASIIFVGLSTPKQEFWMAENLLHLPDCILIGVGAAFDFHAKLLKQAPVWMQNDGLEWFFRLLMEPRRLWKRYLLVTPLFLPLWGLQRIGVLRYSDPPVLKRVR